MYWDDGSHTKVKKVKLTFDHSVIYSIQVIYDGPANQSQLRGSLGPKSAEFTLDSDEYITAFSTYGNSFSIDEYITSFSDDELQDYEYWPYIAALTFTTNKRSLGPYGNKSYSERSSPAVIGKQIAGFLGTLGTSGNILQTIHGHYTPVPISTATETRTRTGTGTGTRIGSESSVAQKLDAQGGTAWDDGSDHDGVTKIYVRSGGDGIQFVKFDYVKGGETKVGAQHGQESRGSTKEIVINHPEEYIVSVEGWYDSSNIILGIQFKTNQKTSQFIGYEFDGTGTKINLQVQDKKIIGFHGFTSNYLNSIGAYFIPTSSTTTPSTLVKKLKAEGGETRDEWDDGHHDDVKKIYVGQGHDGISAEMFEYKNGSHVISGEERGESTKLGFEEFELESDEYLTSVEGTYDSVYGVDGGVIVTMLIFNTNKNRTSGHMGLESSTRFILKEEGYKITGFHGRPGEAINAIGAYLAPLGTIPLIPSTPSQKIEGIGRDEGTLWDDGAFDGIRKVSVESDYGIKAVTFVYAQGPLIGNRHGSNTFHKLNEFELDYPSEYIIAVDGTEDFSRSRGSVITMLRFKTNKQTYGPFRYEDGTAFVLKKDGYKIVGFHGSFSDVLHNLGVHVLPISA